MSTLHEIAELHGALARAYERLAAEEQAPTPESPAPAVFRIAEACDRMGWTYSWAVRRWRKLGGYRDLDGKLKIKAEALARHIPKAAA
jgi:hypothetical protein